MEKFSQALENIAKRRLNVGSAHKLPAVRLTSVRRLSVEMTKLRCQFAEEIAAGKLGDLAHH